LRASSAFPNSAEICANTIRQLIEAMLLRHEARRWTQPTAS
jgi:hypothetical protein